VIDGALRLRHNHGSLVQLDNKCVLIGSSRPAGKSITGRVNGGVRDDNTKTTRSDNDNAANLCTEKYRVERAVAILIEFHKEARSGVWNYGGCIRKRC
jgi:hypothetical protein